MRRWWLGVLVGLTVGSITGCLFELDRGPACGDAYHDPEHEGCDPADPSSFERSCAQDEVATCDPYTCELECGSCGDGRLDAGEACEGNSVRTMPKCQDWSCVGCQVVCPRCGNGEVDPGEECDVDFDAVSIEPHATSCEDIAVPGRPGETYEPGGPVSCRADCRWDRSQCSLCGNGSLDDPIIDPNTDLPLHAGERCDGPVFDQSMLLARCESICGKPGSDCKAECGEGCLNIDVDQQDPECCIRPDYARSQSTPCCCELDQAPSYCSDGFDPPEGGGGSGDLGNGLCPG